MGGITMSFQIKEIVVYDHSGRTRSLKLQTGRLNIITGASKTGKTALIEIMNYCLGSDECLIPAGIIRKRVSWAGIVLSLPEGEAFIARRLPSPDKNASTDIYYEVGRKVKVRPYEALQQNVNRDTLQKLLTKHVGIGMNVNIPPSGQTRTPLSANIKHSLFFTFQQQSEIISNRYLFHKQAEPWIPQAIKDVLPYFMGAVDDDYISKMAHLRELRHELKINERKIAEAEAIRGKGISRAQSLLSEAQDIGLYSAGIAPHSWEDCVEALREVQRKPTDPEEEIFAEGDQVEYLYDERKKLSERLRIAKEELSATRTLFEDRSDFAVETHEQLTRLRSLDLFTRNEDGKLVRCPICENHLSADMIPSLKHFDKVTKQLQDRVRIVDEKSPEMEKVIEQIENNIVGIKRRLQENREELEKVQASNARLQAIRDSASRRAHILGRIGLYLESVPQLEDNSDIKKQIADLQKRIEELERETSDEAIQDRIESILSILSVDMSKWARILDLEHSQFPLRLDIKHLTVIADTDDGPVTMQMMGSGENWVGYHLITHFALHKWLVQKKRPVPRFLFIDQPSQVYFPADKDVDGSMQGIEAEDRDAVARMYKLASDFAKGLKGEFQIIITDHADINEPWFQKCVVERWRGGKKLIPDEW
jgi:methyl-accepting chemotaxis protein